MFALSPRRGENKVFRWFPGSVLPAWVVQHVAAGSPVLAHYTSFEQSIFEHILVPHYGFPVVAVNQWIDTLALAAALNLPLGLGQLGAAIGATVLKDEEGRKLMLSLSHVEKIDGEWIYPTVSPEQLDRLALYCERDVLSMIDCWWKLPKLPPSERELLIVDREINTRGVLLDLPLAAKMEKMTRVREAQIAREVWSQTHDLIGMSSVPALTEWVKDKGVELPKIVRKKADGSFHATESIDRASIATLMAREDLPPVVRSALQLRIEAGRVTSLAKTTRIPDVVNADGRMRHALRYCKAHTGRWTSEILQLHNLAKPTKEFKKVAADFTTAVREGNIVRAGELHPVLDGLSFMLRSLVIAPPGFDLVGGDFAAIEARVVAWLAGQNDVLAAFADPTRDIYVEDAARVGSDNRDLGKEQRLGLGFRMGIVKFRDRAAARGVVLTPKRAHEVVKAWRTNNPKITAFWEALEKAFRAAMLNRGESFFVGEYLTVVAGKECLRIILPSGRALHYWRPSSKLVKKKVKTFDESGVVVEREFESDELRFFTPGKRGMEVETTYSGKLTENVVQAVARDLLAASLVRLHNSPYKVVLHVHDSIAAEVPQGQGSVEEFCQLMAAVPTWAPGLPVAVEGYRSRHFKG